jgi:hypothetical protein
MAHRRRQHAAADEFERKMICHGNPYRKKETFSLANKPDILRAGT